MVQPLEQLLLFAIESDVKEEEAQQTEEVENNTLGFLERFNAVDVSAVTRLSPVEADFCEIEEEVYFETRNVLQNNLKELTALYEKYKGQQFYDRGIGYLSNSDISDLEQRITRCYRDFVFRIVSYFERRHKIQLFPDAIREKYNEDTITSSIVVDEIFNQLGGLTFNEKAIEEIKAASRAIIYRKSNIGITKNKLTVPDLVYWRDGFSDNTMKNLDWNDNRVKPLFFALSHFSDDSLNMAERLTSIYSELQKGSEHYDIWAKYEVTINKIESLKVFKNGKIEIVFTDNSNAEAFKNEYLY